MNADVEGDRETPIPSTEPDPEVPDQRPDAAYWSGLARQVMHRRQSQPPEPLTVGREPVLHRAGLGERRSPVAGPTEHSGGIWVGGGLPVAVAVDAPALCVDCEDDRQAAPASVYCVEHMPDHEREARYRADQSATLKFSQLFAGMRAAEANDPTREPLSRILEAAAARMQIPTYFPTIESRTAPIWTLHTSPKDEAGMITVRCLELPEVKAKDSDGDRAQRAVMTLILAWWAAQLRPSSGTTDDPRRELREKVRDLGRRVCEGPTVPADVRAYFRAYVEPRS